MLILNFNPFPELSTRRLKLNSVHYSDVETIYLLRSSPEVNALLDRPLATNKTDASQFIQGILNGIQTNQLIYWGIRLKETNQLIGTIGLWNFVKSKLSAELGFELVPDYQGNGYMSESISAIIDFGFNKINLKAIEANTHPQNQRSVSLLTKYDFEEVVISEKERTFVLNSTALKSGNDE